MDLVASIRKEGSRGGRGDFSWSDVKDSGHRENYLGHSLMAPVGRWQQGRDLSWYAKTKDDATGAEISAADARKEELRKVKEAEQSALSEALGYGPLMPGSTGGNANETPLGKRDVQNAIRETGAEEEEQEGARGVGFGAYNGNISAGDREVMGGFGVEKRREGAERRDRRAEKMDGRDERRERRRSRSRDRSRERRHRRSRRDAEEREHSRRHHRHSSRDRDRDRERRSHRDRDRDRDDDRRHRRSDRRERSKSPDYDRGRRYR